MSKKKNKLIFLGVGSLSVVALLIIFLTTNQSHFKAGDNVNINKFLKIDSTKYKFSDYSKIIGQNVVPWDNRKASLPKDMTNVKSIDVFYYKKPAKILVYKVKNTDDIVIRLTVGVIGKKNLNLRCDEFLATMPSNFFKSENIKKDSPDFSVMKMIFYTFSKDFQNRRVTGRCISSKGRMDISEQPGYSFINISKKDVSWARSVTAKKLITCNYTRMEDKGKFKKEYSFLKKNKGAKFFDDVKEIKFYIDETLKKLTFYENDLYAGKTIRFDQNFIEVERVNKKQRSTRLYKIDRITGKIIMIYSGSNNDAGKWYINNNFRWVYSGNCNSLSTTKRKF